MAELRKKRGPSRVGESGGAASTSESVGECVGGSRIIAGDGDDDCIIVEPQPKKAKPP